MAHRRLTASVTLSVVLIAGCGGSTTRSASAGSHGAKASPHATARLQAVCQAASNDNNVIQRDEGALNQEIASHKVASSSVRQLVNDVAAARRHAAQLRASVPQQQRTFIGQLFSSLSQDEKAVREIARHELSAANNELIAASNTAGPFTPHLDQMCSP